MSLLPCGCPSCRVRFKIPSDLHAKEARCPRCRALLQLSSAHGKTSVVLLEPGRDVRQQETTLRVDAPARTEAPERPVLPKRRRHGPLVLVALCLLLLLGLGGTLAYLLRGSPSSSGSSRAASEGKGAGVPAPAPGDKDGKPRLSEEERIAWKKLCRANRAYPVRVLGYLRPEKRWRFAAWDLNGPSLYVWKAEEGRRFRSREAGSGAPELFNQDGFAEACDAGRSRAGTPAVEATVVVDLFGNDAPRPLRWFRDDGTKAVASEQAPTPLLAASLAHFLRDYQQRAPALGFSRSTLPPQEENNLKRLALAMQNHAAAYGRLPPQATYDKNGKPMLSWRVLILPYIEEQNLYNQFHLQEPWDSAHNIRLLAHMPETYRPLSLPKTAKPDHTPYQVFVGKGAAFEGEGGLRLSDDFPDGASRTILIVEAATTVPWTKPADLRYSRDRWLPALGWRPPDTFLATLADGSVRRINLQRTSAAMLRAAIARNGGEALGPDW